MEYIAGLAVEKWKTFLSAALCGSPPGFFSSLHCIIMNWSSDGYFIKKAASERKNSLPSKQASK
jgi:hypothetical protein